MPQNHKQQTQVISTRHKKGDVVMRVNLKVHGKPRFKAGLWLIKLGVWLSRVHVRVWIEEERRK